MLLRRFYDDGLAQASYLLGCQATGDAIVVDPNRDIAQYIQAAEAEGLRISHVTETHIHADYVSGSRELAARTGATLLLSAEGGPGWQYGFAASDGATLLRDGDRITVGNIRLDVMHTPGHTPEHLVFLVTDGASADRPMGMLSGDFIFVGDVGRPDLLERAAHVAGTMETAARQIFASLQRTRALPDYLQLWPGHGAGSACGKALGAVPQTTLGYERLFNHALQYTDEDAFVRDILAGQPEPPAYFARMKRINRDGPALLGDAARAPARLDAAGVDAAIARGAWVIDTRPVAEFSAGFIPGTIGIARSRSLTTWFGALVPENAESVLIARTEAEALAVARELRLVGYDSITEWAPASVIEDRRRSGAPVATVHSEHPAAVQARLGNGAHPRLLDVRNANEWALGHIPQAEHAFLGDLEAIMRDAPREAPVVVHCQGGTRSVIATSLLVARGFRDVTNLEGGYAEWQRAGLPVAR